MMAGTHGKLGPNVSTNRNVGSIQAPSPTVAGAELTTEIYTYLAKPSANGQPQILYNGDRQQARVTLTLETAGPVDVGNKQNLLPVGSGKGQPLTTGVPAPFTITKGNRLYVAASTISRIKVTIEPIPWLEQITGMLSLIASAIIGFTKKGH
jgi:hypothetical protein